MWELLKQAMGSVGTFSEVHTVVDFYTYIKMVEYLICIGFFVGFPLFYRFLNSKNERAK